MSEVDAKPLAAINWIPSTLVIVAVAVAVAAAPAAPGRKPAFAAAPMRSPRAARQDRRYGWPGSGPAPRRDRRSAHRSIRGGPRQQHEMRRPAWQNLSWWTMP